MGLRKPQVNVSVEEETKERWEEALEEDNRFSTMSDLVRVSVEREISSENENENTGGESGVSGKEFAELLERVETLENAIQGIGSDFQELKGIIESQSPNTQNLKSEVFAALPQDIEGVHNYATPEEIASKIGGPVRTQEVSDVLEELANQTGQVQEVFGPEEGEIYYNKKGDKL